MNLGLVTLLPANDSRDQADGAIQRRGSAVRAMGVLGLIGVLACSSATGPQRAGSAPVVPPNSTSQPRIADSRISNADVAKQVDVSPTAPTEVGDPWRHDPADLAMVTLTRVTIFDRGDSYDEIHVQEDRNLVAACYAKLPVGRRTDVPFAATLERPNPSYQGNDTSALWGVGDSLRPAPLGIEEPTFTDCVTRALSHSTTISLELSEPTGLLEAEREAVRSVRIDVLAFPYGSVERYATGSIGHGRGH